MHIISTRPLRDFYVRYPDAEGSIRAWISIANRANWQSFNEMKRQLRSASIVGNDRAVFNIAGNKYRLVVLIRFDKQRIFIRFIGTHGEYDKINASTV